MTVHQYRIVQSVARTCDVTTAPRKQRTCAPDTGATQPDRQRATDANAGDNIFTKGAK